ncbi:hypothetical protein [Bacillus massiliglaciei]|uniref:hypothetical protein n=1 Tax=Bacillus massiliglaciei TaxID=1816693 RepID=UPI000DA617DA|nr:hypothetical protein [Bacillus massiliglaciei]
MNRKIFILLGLIAVLVFLTFYMTKPIRFQEVEIVEKYYPHFSDGKAIGFKTDEVIDVSKTEEGDNCAMKFSNGQILEIDCDRYLNYKVDETVYIKYSGKEITEIRRKK